jgi:hypothetical protein
MAYEKRQDRDDLWEVYDTGTDEVVVKQGEPLVGLNADEAGEAVELLNSGAVTPDNPQTSD